MSANDQLNQLSNLLHLLHLTLLRDIDRKLDMVLASNAKLEKIGAKIMSTGVTAQQALSDLQAKVAAETTVQQSAITLLQQLASQVSAANGVSPAAVEAVVAQIQSNIDNLAGAVTANTPVSTAPPQVGVSTPNS